MSRIGKIARLPQNTRDQIHEKLHEGVHGVTILLGTANGWRAEGDAG